MSHSHSHSQERIFNSLNKSFTDGDAAKAALLPFFLLVPSRSRYLLCFQGETPQPTVFFAQCPGIDKAFYPSAVAEARNFHCYSHVCENFGKRSLPNDHAVVRVVIQKRMSGCNQDKRISSCMSQHKNFCTILKHIREDHQYLADPYSSCRFQRHCRETHLTASAALRA